VDKIKIARELVKLAKLLASQELPSSEKKVAEKMKKKGYKYAVQIVTIDGDFGEPLYFKTANEVGPFLRSFPEYKKAKIKWTVEI
jgi:hypothetical protein